MKTTRGATLEVEAGTALIGCPKIKVWRDLRDAILGRIGEILPQIFQLYNDVAGVRDKTKGSDTSGVELLDEILKRAMPLVADIDLVRDLAVRSCVSGVELDSLTAIEWLDCSELALTSVISPLLAREKNSSAALLTVVKAVREESEQTVPEPSPGTKASETPESTSGT